MNKLIYVLFFSIFSLDYISDRISSVGRYITWFPELISIILILVISIFITVKGVKSIPKKCGVFLFLFLLNIIIGVFVNSVPEGPLIAGLRTYLKYIPIFLLPFLYHFSTQNINNQLKFLVFISIVQAPLSLYQRLILSKGYLTGDFVKGTLATSGHLTVFLTCAIAILMSFYLTKRIKLIPFISIFICLFIPMTLNETKVTIILLPIALLCPLYFSSSEIKIKQFVPLISIIIISCFAFVFIYDYFMKPRWGYGILDFLSMEGRTEKYLYTGKGGLLIGKVARVDSYIWAFKTLYENVLSLLFGLGIGNVSESFISGLSGEYAEEYSIFNPKMTSLTIILWELGIFGVILYYYFYFMVFKYSRHLKKYDSFNGGLSNGWASVSILMAVSTAYSAITNDNVIGYLFWYFSGYIISEQYRYKKYNLNVDSMAIVKKNVIDEKVDKISL